MKKVAEELTSLGTAVAVSSVVEKATDSTVVGLVGGITVYPVVKTIVEELDLFSIFDL